MLLLRAEGGNLEAWWASESGRFSRVPEYVRLKGGSPEALKTAHFRGAARGGGRREATAAKESSHLRVFVRARAPEISNTKHEVEWFYPCGLVRTKKRVLFCFLFPLGAVFSKTSIRGYIYY